MIDCRDYRNFINITSIKSATNFMNGKDEKSHAAQILWCNTCGEPRGLTDGSEDGRDASTQKIE